MKLLHERKERNLIEDLFFLETISNGPVEHFSSTTSENRLNDFDSSHLETEDMASHVSLLATNNERTRELDNQFTNSSNFSITWLDSLKEQNSPERKIQFYENLIQLLEQDTLNIDELLVLRKILAKIWPNEDPAQTSNEKVNFSMGSRSVRSLYVKEHGSTTETIQQHTPRRYPTNSDRTSSNYESLHELKSGHPLKSTSLLISAIAKPCVVKNDFNRRDDSVDYRTSDHNYPMNNFDLPRDSTGNSFDERLNFMLNFMTTFSKTIRSSSINTDSNQKPTKCRFNSTLF